MVVGRRARCSFARGCRRRSERRTFCRSESRRRRGRRYRRCFPSARRSRCLRRGDCASSAPSRQPLCRTSARSVRTKPLATSHAFHSQLMDPALTSFQAAASETTFRPAQIPLVCNVSGAMLSADEVLDGEYWAQHIRQPVRYPDAINAVQEFGCDVILEIGPQSVLTRMAPSCLIFRLTSRSP